jgi:PAS domain S-box-containing protein
MTPSLHPGRDQDGEAVPPAADSDPLILKVRCFDALQQPLWAVDAEDRTIEVNAAVERELGYSREELMGRSPSEFLTPESVEVYRSQSILRAAGMADSFECTFRLPNGGTRTMLVSGSPIWDGERMVAKIAVLKDISKWRATDETTRILERLIHDVRTHLTTIVGFTGLLAQGSAGDLNDEQRREFLLVRDAADRVLHLVAGLQAMLTTPGGGSRKAP